MSAWHLPDHVKSFELQERMGYKESRRRLEQSADFSLLKRYRKTLRGRCLFDIGCATGVVGRCIRQTYRQFRYKGFDISQLAIDHAMENYPNVDFETCEEDLSDITEAPTIVFCRDVIHHQPKPFAYIEKLLSLPSEAALLRLRTRDAGPTILDIQGSNQRVYGEIVPYILVNIGELLTALLDVRPVSVVHIVRQHKALEGGNDRHLPTAVDQAGAAISSVWLSFSDGGLKPPRIIIE